MVAGPDGEFDAEGRLTGKPYRDALSALMAKLKAETGCSARMAA